MAVLDGCPARSMNITNLNKALFYLDLFELRDAGKTATEATYIALAQGPVVAKYDKRLVKPLVDAGLVVQDQRGDAKPLVAKAELDRFEFLDERVRKLAANIGRAVASRTAAFISERSHENPGWKVAFADGVPRPIDLHLALQEMVDVDPWLEEDDDDTAAAFARADRADDEGLRW